MNFSNLIEDLRKLEGLSLSSIRPGAEIVIDTIDIAQGKVFITTASGKKQTRPISEFMRIWEGLSTAPAVHVDELLHGSGSSRNQPETILANLPYIEWLKINNKKHISYVGKPTHPYGTLQQMNALEASKLSEKMSTSIVSMNISAIIATNDLAITSERLSQFCGNAPKVLSSGVYSFDMYSSTIVLVEASAFKLPCGTYSRFSVNQGLVSQRDIRIGKVELGVFFAEDIKGFFLKNLYEI